jgi:hypothetical protein
MRVTAMRQSLSRSARDERECEETGSEESAAKHQRFKPVF